MDEIIKSKTVDQLILEQAGGLYLGGMTELTVEACQSWLRAYERSCSMEMACKTTGISQSQVRRRILVDQEFADAYKIIDEGVKSRVEAKLIDAAMNGVVEEEWEEADGRRFRRKQDFRYLDRLLKQRIPEKYGDQAQAPAGGVSGSGGSVLQINISGMTLQAQVVPPGPKQVEMDL